MKSSLIISTYNWADALFLCLKSIENLSLKPDEIIIGDDGSSDHTKKIIDDFRERIGIPIIHIWHKDKGFRLAEIRNKAISYASGDYIIQIDGDVILHKNFIKDHLDFAKKGCFVKGYRLMIGIQKSKALLENKSIKISWLSRGMSFRENGIYLPFIHKIFKPKEVATSNSVMGSNMAFFKEDFIKVNGYDNSLQGWGAEDKELAQRFVNAGLKRRKMKFLGIQYHLYHKEEDKSNQPSHLNFTSQIEKSKTITCKNGLLQTDKDFIVYE